CRLARGTLPGGNRPGGPPPDGASPGGAPPGGGGTGALSGAGDGRLYPRGGPAWLPRSPERAVTVRLRSHRRRRTARSTSLAASRRARSCLLSYVRLPRASASSTLTLPSLKYSDSGTRVRPCSDVLRTSRSISPRCSRSFLVRLGTWLVHVPSVYSGI